MGPSLGSWIASSYFNQTEADSNNEITGTNEHKNKGQVRIKFSSLNPPEIPIPIVIGPSFGQVSALNLNMPLWNMS